jgi:hypothetical protein
MLKCFAFRVVNVDPSFLQQDDVLLGEPRVLASPSCNVSSAPTRMRPVETNRQCIRIGDQQPPAKRLRSTLNLTVRVQTVRLLFVSHRRR